MWGYVVSIGSTVLLISIITLVIPSGKLYNFVSYILSILLIFSIIKPLFNLSIKEFNFANLVETSINIDEEYVDYTLYLRANELSKYCINLLSNENVIATKIEINYDSTNYRDFSIKNVKVFLCREVIYPDNSNIDIIARTKTLLSNFLNVNEGVIEIIE